MNKGHSASCFIYGYVSSDQKKKERYYWLHKRHFYMEIIVTMVSVNLVRNTFSSLFCLSWKPENKNQIFCN